MAITPPPTPPPGKKRTRLAATAFLLIWLIFSIFEPANGARGGHPRTVPYSKMSSKCRTGLQIILSRAKNVEKAAGDVRFPVFPQKRRKMPPQKKHQFFGIFASFLRKYAKTDVASSFLDIFVALDRLIWSSVRPLELILE